MSQAEQTSEHPEITLFESTPQFDISTDDIYDELLSRKWIIHYENGLIGFGREFLALFEYFDQAILNLARHDQALEYIYPDFIDIESLNRLNYLSNFPSHVMFASHLQENPDMIHEFSGRISHDDGCLCDEFLDKPKYINKASVCVHVYKQFEHETIDLQNPILITSKGKCKRFESIHMDKVERLLDFSMREIVFIGSKEYVLSKREQYMEWTKRWVEKLGIQAAIKTSDDPFFTNDPLLKETHSIRIPQKYELKMRLGYNSKEISVGSFNYHGDFFSNGFQICSSTGEKVYSGCIGFGLERLAYAYLCQLGLRNLDMALSRL